MEGKIYYTLDEVAKITGVPLEDIKKYTLGGYIKYFNKRRRDGKLHIAYSKDSVFQINQISLYKEIGYSMEEISDVMFLKTLIG